MRHLEGMKALSAIKFLLILLAFLAGFSGRVLADYQFSPGLSIQGPGKAKGAVIWNHGLARLGDPNPILPPYLKALEGDGWDVFKLVRLWSGDKEYDSSQALLAEGKKLKDQGYRQVVTAGQSFGGWISFIATADEGNPFDALIATAPAAHGEFGQSSNWQRNAGYLYPLVKGMKPIPALVFFFAKDNYDPGGRGLELRAIFEGKNQPYGLVDQPSGHSGHGAANSAIFARQFGPCLVSFLGALSSLKGPFDCQTVASKTDLSTFSLPAGMAQPPGGTGLPGRWMGALENGRGALLQIDELADGVGKAVYAWSARGDKAGYLQLSGRLDGDVLRLIGTKVIVEFRQTGEDRGDIRWMRPDGSNVLSGQLERSR